MLSKNQKIFLLVLLCCITIFIILKFKPKPKPTPTPTPPNPNVFTEDIYGFGKNVDCEGLSWNQSNVIMGPCPWLYMGSPVLVIAAKTTIANAPKNKPASLIFGVGYIDSLGDGAPIGACYRNKDRTIIIQKANPTNSDCTANPVGNCNVDLLIAGNGEPNYACCGAWLSDSYKNISQKPKQNMTYSDWSAACASTFNYDFCTSWGTGPPGGGIYNTQGTPPGYTNSPENNCKIAFPNDSTLQTACVNTVNSDWGKDMELIPCKAPRELIAVTKLYNKDWQNGNYPSNSSMSKVENVVREWYEDPVDLSALQNTRPKLQLLSNNMGIKNQGAFEGHDGCRPENASMKDNGGLSGTTHMVACVKSPEADSLTGSITKSDLPDGAIDLVKNEVLKKGLKVVCNNEDNIALTKSWFTNSINASDYNIKNFNGKSMSDLIGSMGCVN